MRTALIVAVLGLAVAVASGQDAQLYLSNFGSPNLLTSQNRARCEARQGTWELDPGGDIQGPHWKCRELSNAVGEFFWYVHEGDSTMTNWLRVERLIRPHGGRRNDDVADAIFLSFARTFRTWSDVRLESTAGSSTMIHRAADGSLAAHLVMNDYREAFRNGYIDISLTVYFPPN